MYTDSYQLELQLCMTNISQIMLLNLLTVSQKQQLSYSIIYDLQIYGSSIYLIKTQLFLAFLGLFIWLWIVSITWVLTVVKNDVTILRIVVCGIFVLVTKKADCTCETCKVICWGETLKWLTILPSPNTFISGLPGKNNLPEVFYEKSVMYLDLQLY